MGVLGGAVLIAYTYVGYACWLRVRVVCGAWPVYARVASHPPLSIVMVVRNEDRDSGAKLRNLLALDYPADRCQIVVVSDGSTDRTEDDSARVCATMRGAGRC